MAAKSAAAPEAAPAPAPIPVAAHTRGSPAKAIASGPAAPEVNVILWDNETQGHRHADTPGARAADDALPGREKTEEIPGKAPAKETPKPETPEPEAEAPKTKTAAEKRSEAFDRLAAERRVRELEGALKKEQTDRGAERDEAAKLAKAVKDGTLAEFFALRGIGQDEALEMLLRKDPALEGVPPKGAPKADPALAELLSKVNGLEAKLAKYEQAEGDAKLAQTYQLIETQTKDLDIPVTRAVENGYELVLRTAHELFLASGRNGKMADYLPDAAARAEAHFRETKPGLAALADAAKGGTPKPKTEAADPPTGSIGRRGSARPDVKTKSVWDGKHPIHDRAEIDEQIKREFGFVDKAQDEE
jgi:hypothetical protein